MNIEVGAEPTTLLIYSTSTMHGSQCTALKGTPSRQCRECIASFDHPKYPLLEGLRLEKTVGIGIVDTDEIHQPRPINDECQEH